MRGDTPDNMTLQDRDNVSIRTVRSADRYVSADLLRSDSPWGTRFINLIVSAFIDGALPYGKSDANPSTTCVVDDDRDVCFIPRTLVTSLMTRIGIQAPVHSEVIRGLESSGNLVGTRYHDVTGYVIPLSDINLYWSAKLSTTTKVAS
jgi:hypothetical protein